jgi:hypothetical protein
MVRENEEDKSNPGQFGTAMADPKGKNPFGESGDFAIC